MAKKPGSSKRVRSSRKPPAAATPKAAGRSAAARAAERAMPGWKAVMPVAAPDVATRGTSTRTDASVPELRSLKEKYFGANDTRNSVNTPTNDAEIVQMESKTPGVDTHAGRKSVVVQKNRAIGKQG